MSEPIVTPILEPVNRPMKPTRTCVWCSPPHVLEAGDPGAPTSHGLCAVALAREQAKFDTSPRGLAARFGARALRCLERGGDPWLDTLIAAHFAGQEIIRRDGLYIDCWVCGDSIAPGQAYWHKDRPYCPDCNAPMESCGDPACPQCRDLGPTRPIGHAHQEADPQHEARDAFFNRR